MFRRLTAIVRRELGATVAGIGQFYVGYLQMAVPRRGSIVSRLLSLIVFLIPLAFLIGHPFFPPWLKIVAAIGVLGAALMIARDFVHHARTASYETRPAVRGALIGLFPFFLAAVVSLIWGLTEVLPSNQGNPWMVVLNSSFPQEFPAGPVHPRFGYTPDMAESLGRATGLDFWCYGIQATTGIVIAPIIEQVSGLFGERIVVARMWAWNEAFMLLELIVQILSATMFIGIIADIALAVQNKFAMGEDIGAELGENFGMTMVKASKDLQPPDLERLIKAQAGFARIRQRTFTNLRTHLASVDPVMRARAAEALGDWGDGNAAMVVANVLRTDPDARVRTAAAYALEDLDEPRTASALVQALATDESADVRTAARVALRGWAPKEAVTPLMKALDMVDATRRDEIAAALAEVIETANVHDEVVPQIVETLRDSDVTETRCGLFETMSVMISRTRADNMYRPDRQRLAQAMQTALETATEILHDDDDSNFPARTAAAEFLGRAARWIASADRVANTKAADVSPTVAAVLVSELDVATRDADGSDADVQLRAALLDALGRLGGEAAVEALKPHIEATPEAVGLAAIKGLGRTRHPAAVSALIEKLAALESGWGPRAEEICHALGRLRDEQARPILEAHINHTPAVVALSRIGSVDALPTLLAAFDQPKPAADSDALGYRKSVVRSIGHILQRLREQSPLAEPTELAQQATTKLMRALTQADVDVLPAVSEAVGRAQGMAAVDALRKALTDRSDRAVAVARGLAALDDMDVLAALADVLPEAGQSVQGVILDALSRLGPSAMSDELMGRLHASFSRIGLGAAKVLFSTSRRLEDGDATDDSSDRPNSLKETAAAVPRWLMARMIRRDDETALLGAPTPSNADASAAATDETNAAPVAVPDSRSPSAP